MIKQTVFLCRVIPGTSSVFGGIHFLTLVLNPLVPFVSQDPMNRTGGRWVARNIPRHMRDRLWSYTVMAVIGETLEEEGNIQSVCGVVLSTRETGDNIQLWLDGGYRARQRMKQSGVCFGTHSALLVQGTMEQRPNPCLKGCKQGARRDRNRLGSCSQRHLESIPVNSPGHARLHFCSFRALFRDKLARGGVGLYMLPCSAPCPVKCPDSCSSERSERSGRELSGQ